jgi:hypothetical protein
MQLDVYCKSLHKKTPPCGAGAPVFVWATKSFNECNDAIRGTRSRVIVEYSLDVVNGEHHNDIPTKYRKDKHLGFQQQVR